METYVTGGRSVVEFHCIEPDTYQMDYHPVRERIVRYLAPITVRW